MTDVNYDLRCYLLSSVIDWCNVNNLKAHILVNGVKSDPQFAGLSDLFNGEDHVILNVSYSAIKDYFIDDKGMSFKAMFNGTSYSFFIDLDRITLVNGFISGGKEGVFGLELSSLAALKDITNPVITKDIKEKPKKVPSFLKIVK